MTPLRSKLDCFSYLSAPNSTLYQAILAVFAEARTEFQLNLRAVEIADKTKLSLSEETVVAALDQLCQWGNLEAFNDHSQAVSLQEFYRRHLYYQMTSGGVAALRAIDLFYELVQTPASLQASALAAVRDRLAELIGMAKAHEQPDQKRGSSGPFDVPKASSLLEVLFDELENLTNQAQEFFRGLQATVELRETSVDAFLNFKDRLVHYVERFLNQVVNVAGQAEAMIESVDEMMIETMLRSIALHRTVDEMEVTQERIEQVYQRLRLRWSGVVGWFVSPAGKTSQADELRALARLGIREIAAAATRLNRAASGMVDRSTDFRRLAVWFAQCPDARSAHRLWRTAFALSPARHLTITEATLIERDQTPIAASSPWSEAPPLRIAPTIRSSGRVAKSARTPRMIDNREQLQSLRQQALQETAELNAAMQQLLTPRRRMSELPQMTQQAFPLLLDLLGEALTLRGNNHETVLASSTDGSMNIRLEPTNDDSQCNVVSSWGQFSGQDFWLSIHSSNEQKAYE